MRKTLLTVIAILAVLPGCSWKFVEVKTDIKSDIGSESSSDNAAEETVVEPPKEVVVVTNTVTRVTDEEGNERDGMNCGTSRGWDVQCVRSIELDTPWIVSTPHNGVFQFDPGEFSLNPKVDTTENGTTLSLDIVGELSGGCVITFGSFQIAHICHKGE